MVEAECMASNFQGFMICIVEYEGVGCQNWVCIWVNPGHKWVSNKELTRSYTHSTNYSRINKVQLVSVTYNILACKISILSCQVATSVYFDEKDFARTEVLHVEVEKVTIFSVVQVMGFCKSLWQILFFKVVISNQFSLVHGMFL